MTKREDLKVGDYIAVLNNVFRDNPPYSRPLKITAITAKRITAHVVARPGRESDDIGRTRYLSPGEILRVFPDLETGHEVCMRAYEAHREMSEKIKALEIEQARQTRRILKGEE